MPISSMYPGYYAPDEAQLDEAWKNGFFVFDTSVLLGLYRYDRNTRDQLLKVLDQLKERIWIPYHVGLEYERRRLPVIGSEKRAFDGAVKIVTESVSKIIATFESRTRNPHPSEDLQKLLTQLAQLGTQMAEEVKKIGTSQRDVHEDDAVRTALSAVLEGRVGSPPAEEWLEGVQKAGKSRFEWDEPPGSRDEDKKESYSDRGLRYEAKYGDLIVWQQTLDRAKDQHWPALIFVTDDAKDDWWMEESGKRIGPRPELREEGSRIAGLAAFQMYNSALFLEHAKRFLNADISDQSIAQVRETNQASSALQSEPFDPQQFEQLAIASIAKLHERDRKVVIRSREPFDLRVAFENFELGIVVARGSRSPLVMVPRIQSILQRIYDAPAEEASNAIALYFVYRHPTAAEEAQRRLIGANDGSTSLRSVKLVFGYLNADTGYEFLPLTNIQWS